MEKNLQNKNVEDKQKEKRDVVGLVLATVFFVLLIVAIIYGITNVLLRPTL